MLIRFNVANFLSFKEIQEFSMIAGKVRSKKEHLMVDDNLKLMKFAAIFGANASGKSNLVKAIEFATDNILGKKSYNYDGWFKLDDTYKSKGSYFEFEIKIDNKYYSYGFEMLLSLGIYTSEWLLELNPNGDNQVIFERNIKEETFNTDITINDEKLRNKFNVYADDIKSNQETLFINELNRNKSHQFKDDPDLKIFTEIFKWFGIQLEINHPLNLTSDLSYFAEVEKGYILDIIKSFGTGITDFNIVELTAEEVRDQIPEKILVDIQKHVNEALTINDEIVSGTGTLVSSDGFYIVNIDKNKKIKVTTVEFEHGKKGKPYIFSVSEESDGTRRIIELIQILLSEENKTYIIDEIDRSLHPQLTYKFIENFLEIAKKRNIQLVITTHESRLLDFGLLRQDEVWLMNKNELGASQVYSLDEYNVRFDQKIDKAYLEGRYGGVPIFSSIFPVKGD